MKQPPPTSYLGVDTGGTFTDFFLLEGTTYRTHKVLSTPDSPDKAITQGIKDLGLMPLVKAGQVIIVHGSTVATNAALEKKGVPTAYITNKGFADMLTLGRQNRDDIYALQPKAIEPPVPEKLCLEVDVRRGSKGEIITALSDEAIQTCVQKLLELNPRSVAINFLFSFLDSEDEKRLAEAIPKQFFVSISSEVLPEYKEYERGMATWLNAWLGPKVETYLQQLLDTVSPCPLGVMQSSGGTIDAQQASRRAVNLLLSGPAGGLAAANAIGQQIERRKLMTFDMGGTSTDVALLDGGIRLTTEGKLGAYPVAVPMVDMHTIGAGGGSIAYLDVGGMLHVGPESAGASPGPACYGQGGEKPTVTDANVVLGRIRPEQFLGGNMTLDEKAATKAVKALAKALNAELVEAAKGIIALANEHMAAALRLISVQQGFDPADFTLCCFGGAGGLHVCALAEELGMRQILVPANGGVLSAFGMLVAPPQRQLSRTLDCPLAELDQSKLDTVFQTLQKQGEQELQDEGVESAIDTSMSLDLCYSGQSFTLNIEYQANFGELEGLFNQLHEESYGHALGLPVQVMNARVRVSSEAAIQQVPPTQIKAEKTQRVDKVNLPEFGGTQILVREALAVGAAVTGPAIICETVATTLIAPGWSATVDPSGHLLVDKC